MKRTLCMAIALSSWSLGSPAADEARQEYEETVGQLYGFMSALPHTFEWCREKYPDISQSLAEALAKWHERYDGLLADLERRLLVTFGQGGKLSPEEQTEVLNIIRKKVATELRASLDENGTEQMRMSCLVLPAGIDTPALDVEKRFPEELKRIREYDAS